MEPHDQNKMMIEDQASHEDEPQKRLWNVICQGHDGTFEEERWDAVDDFNKNLKEEPCFKAWFSETNLKMKEHLRSQDASIPCMKQMMFQDRAVAFQYREAMWRLLENPQFLSNSSDIKFDMISGVDYDYWKTKNQAGGKFYYFDDYQANFNIVETMRSISDRNMVVVFWKTGFEKKKFPALVILPRGGEEGLTNEANMKLLKKHVKEIAQAWNDGSIFYAVSLNFEMMQFLKVSEEDKKVLVSPVYGIDLEQSYFSKEPKDLENLYCVIYGMLKDVLKKF